MAETKYGEHLIKAEIMAREGEAPALRFSATEYGVNASWVLLPVTNVKPSASDLPTHKHDFHRNRKDISSIPRRFRTSHRERLTVPVAG